MPDELVTICKYDNDCAGITCCLETLLGDVSRNLQFSVKTDECQHTVEYGIEKKIWQSTTTTTTSQESEHKSCLFNLDLEF